MVNIGIRQQGREHGRNVVDAAATVEAILGSHPNPPAALLRQSLRGMENPYGDGHSAAKIASVLGAVELGEQLLIKKSR